MRSLIVRLALALMVACSTFFIASSQVDIDYSHSVVGTGTLITDYHMGAEQSSEASGKVRGTGNVMNKYLFLSENDSQNVTIEDQFTLSGKAAAPKEITFSSFPPGSDEPDSFRLTGASWAERLVVLGSVGNSNSSLQSAERLKVQNVSYSQDGGGAFRFKGESIDEAAMATTAISNAANLDANAFLRINRGEKTFDYQSSWYNSSRVHVKSLVGDFKASIYEDDGLIDGESTGQKSLIVSS